MDIDIFSLSILSQIALYAINWYYNLDLPWFVLWSPIMFCLLFTAMVLVAVTVCGIAIMENIDDAINVPVTKQFDEKEDEY